MLELAGTFHERDPDFRFTDETWKMVSTGVAREDWDEFNMSVSLDHAIAIRNQLLEKKYRNERLARDGRSARLAKGVTHLIDPSLFFIWAAPFLVLLRVVSRLYDWCFARAEPLIPGSTDGYQVEGEE